MSLLRTPLSVLALAVCFATSSCIVTEARTEVLIDIDADPGVRVDAMELITTVRGGLMHSAYTTEYTERRPRPSFPLTLSVAPIDQDIRRVVEVAVLARSSDGAIIGRYQLRTRYVAGQSSRITILLTDCCRGVARTCVAGESCSECECQVLAEELPDAGPVDAGMSEDAPISPDASLPSCRTSIDCPPHDCQTGVCTDSRCVYTPTCAAGEACCGNQCAANCDCVGIALGRTCRASSDDCDAAEVCDGSNPACPPDAAKPALTLCRDSAGVCDIAESCDGVNMACPGNVFALGTTCPGGFCDATGMCGACVSNGPCRYTATQDPCDLGRRDCAAGTCSPGVAAPATTLCRTSRGPCDAPEYCTGSSTACPADALLPTTTVCNPASGPCDVEERCTSAGTCPADVKQSAGFVCSRSRSLCELDAICDGASSVCHPGAFASASTVCRPAVTGIGGESCDVAERCTGSSGLCPSDAVMARGTLCRVSESVSCDQPEFCDGGEATCPPNETIPGACAELGSCGTCRGGRCQTSPCGPTQSCCETTMTCQERDSSPCLSGGT